VLTFIIDTLRARLERPIRAVVSRDGLLLLLSGAAGLCVNGATRADESVHRETAAQPTLDPSNFWFSSYSQGLGIMSAGQWDLEANLYAMGSHFTGLALPAENGGGLQNGQISARHQIADAPGLDFGFVVGGSDLSQGTTAGDVQSRSASAFLTAHYAAKFHEGFGAGMYMQVGGAGQQSGDAAMSTTGVIAISPVLAWEPEDRFINSLAFNPVTVSFNQSGGLSQGPSVRHLIGLGANIGLAMNVAANSVLMPEFSYVHSHGSALGSGGQAASSDTYRFGIVDTISYLGHGSAGPQTNSIAIGIWYSLETGSISGPSLSDSGAGPFGTRAIMIGATFGCRRADLHLCGW
jgi:hypothetical protein